MNLSTDTGYLILLSIAAAWLAGLIVLTWGRRTARQGDWIVWGALALLLIALSLSGISLHEHAWTPRSLLRGWIWPRAETGAITVGIHEDLLGLAMSGLAVFVSGVLLSTGAVFGEEGRNERIFAAIAIAVAGVVLSWISLTPWLAFLGMAATVLGGFLSLGSKWSMEEESVSANRFLWERCGGLLLVMIGSCGLAASRNGLVWGESTGWIELSATNAGDLIGATLLILGLFVQFRPFPFLGGLLTQTDTPISVRIVLTQLFPAWSAFAILFRFFPQFKAMGVLPVLTWLQLGAAAVALFAGILQPIWRSGFTLWFSAGLSLACATLTHSGPANGLSVLIAISFGGTVVAMAATALASGGTHSLSNKSKALWCKVAGVAGIAAACGLIGFVSAGGYIRSLAAALDDTAGTVLLGLVILLFVIHGAKLAGVLSIVRNPVKLGWPNVLAPFLLLLLCFGFFWNGTISGGALLGHADLMIQPLIGMFFSSGVSEVSDEAFLSGSWIFWSTAVIGAGLGYYLAQRPQPKQTSALVRFGMTGLGADQATQLALKGITRFATLSQTLVDRKIWAEWVPFGLVVGFERISSFLVRADSGMTALMNGTLRKGIEVPAKILQVLQNGDVQWYLFFAVGSAVAILVHFLKF